MPVHTILFQIRIALKKMGIQIDTNERYFQQEAARIKRLLENSDAVAVTAALDIIPWNPSIPVTIRRFSKE